MAMLRNLRGVADGMEVSEDLNVVARKTEFPDGSD